MSYRTISTTKSGLGGRRGQAMAEFAVSLVAFITLLAGIVALGEGHLNRIKAGMAARYIGVKLSHNIDNDVIPSELQLEYNGASGDFDQYPGDELIDRRGREFPSSFDSALQRYARRASIVYFKVPNPSVGSISSCNGTVDRVCVEVFEDYREDFLTTPGPAALEPINVLTQEIGAAFNDNNSLAELPWFYSPIQLAVAASDDLSPTERLMLYGPNRVRGLTAVSYFEIDSGTLQRSESGGLLDGLGSFVVDMAESLIESLGF